MRTAGMTIILTAAFMGVVVLMTGCGNGEPSATAPSQTEQGGEVITQTTCPVLDNPIDKSIFVEHEGRKVYFCCQACVGTFQKDPAKYMAKLDAAK